MSSMRAILEDSWNNAQNRLSAVQSALRVDSTPCSRVVRIAKLDAELLDQELVQLLQDPLSKALSIIGASFKSRVEPELRFLIHLTLYKLSIWDIGTSYGAKLQDLKYVVPFRNERLTSSGLPRRILLVHGALSLLVPYIHARITSYALSHAWSDAPSTDRRRKAWTLLNTLESTHALLGLVNFIVFLYNGRYRTVIDRLLGMQLVPSDHHVQRDVSYEFMNRQMVWHAFTEFLLFILPLINARAIRRRIHRLLTYFSPSSVFVYLVFRSPSSLAIPEKSDQEKHSVQRRGKYWYLPDNQCAICAENATFSLQTSERSISSITLASSTQSAETETEPTAFPVLTPYVTSCGHIYCYYCIAERMLRASGEDEVGWNCLRCGELTRAVDRYVADMESEGSDYEFSSDLDLNTTDWSTGSHSESGQSDYSV